MSDLTLARAGIGPSAIPILTAALKFSGLLNRSSGHAMCSTEQGYRAHLAHEIQIFGMPIFGRRTKIDHMVTRKQNKRGT